MQLHNKLDKVIQNLLHRNVALFLIAIIISNSACKKLVQIAPPVATITTAQTFADSVDADAAILGIYTQMINHNLGGLTFGNGAITIYSGMSADELLPFFSEGDQVSTNTLIPTTGVIDGFYWLPAYQLLYQINASIEGVQASAGITQTAKIQLIGEAKFLRAFCYFYLVNFFGDVPYTTTSDYRKNAIAPRTPKDQIYDSIINDLKQAQNTLPNDYSYSGGERVRANSLAATALLSRVYLFTSKWTEAETQATAIINNTSLFGLSPDLNQVFLANNSEAILQWNLNTQYQPFNATPEAWNLIPFFSFLNPRFYLTSQLLNGFEAGDQRKTAWIDSSIYDDGITVKTYYIPYKYKIGPSTAARNAPATEYYMVLRVAEQYLIRAEAEAQLNDLVDAISDVNAIRSRAGLPNLSSMLNQTEVLAAVAQERRIELFAEWGHRWLDLKRTGQARAVLSIIPYKSAWQDHQQLYPIPAEERLFDPNLTQNPGY